MGHVGFKDAPISEDDTSVCEEGYIDPALRGRLHSGHGIISPAAATYAKAVIAGVQRDLPVYRRRDEERQRGTGRCGQPKKSGMVVTAVNLALQSVGISQECWDIARMLRHDPPVRLILMTAYHRLRPYRSREEEELQQYVKAPAVGDEGAISTFQKLQAWKSAARRLRQMGGTLPGVTALKPAFDKILAAFNVDSQRGKWFYKTERNKLPMVDISPGQAAHFFHSVEVNLNQTTTMVGYLPATAAKAHALEAKPKAKPKDKPSSGQAGTAKASSAPSSRELRRTNAPQACCPRGH